jgi:hypothetical protein
MWTDIRVFQPFGLVLQASVIEAETSFERVWRPGFEVCRRYVVEDDRCSPVSHGSGGQRWDGKTGQVRLK